MFFIDEVKIHLKAGDGGNGAVSFHRAKFIEFGGPDGGNGGKGGDIILCVDDNITTLANFRYRQHFIAANGANGSGSNRTGFSGDDLIITIPAGTQVFDNTYSYLMHDLEKNREKVVIAKGGLGGAGNACFKSSVSRAPTRAIKGKKGDEFSIWLSLKLLSDIGIIGLPNAGKSTFLSIVTDAKPKVSDYPFTTLSPQLGVFRVDINKEVVLADIPGLIEGASEGLGLGDRFLKHIERCNVLVHVVDVTTQNPVASYHTVRNELTKYSMMLAEKKELIVLSKCDLISEDEITVLQNTFINSISREVMRCTYVERDTMRKAILKAIDLTERHD
ncbi:Obg family GTPase CgtA [Candidatus Fokinia crypta]|uniref:GTPase Obg n=1 Tax=Candidatus Fokinia crypta TaxID=1920990 RepID=A0ABZ0USV3_9RICK|nr:GTPase ObgE [Candidatus Fokinia cryptica]WPX97768.1 GTPase Obg [Candidatus Fokinia cryptica]